jgi:hypothetical protein
MPTSQGSRRREVTPLDGSSACPPKCAFPLPATEPSHRVFWLPSPRRCTEQRYVLVVVIWLSAVAAALTGQIWGPAGQRYPIVLCRHQEAKTQNAPRRGKIDRRRASGVPYPQTCLTYARSTVPLALRQRPHVVSVPSDHGLCTMDCGLWIVDCGL